MPFSGVNVACTIISEKSGASLSGDVQWSKNFTSDVLSAGVQTTPTCDSDDNCLEISAAVDVWISFGTKPDDPSKDGSRRILVRAGDTRNLAGKIGYRVSVAAA